MKPTILVLTEVYLPGYLAGGPVRSLAGLVDALGDEFIFKIITTDRDLRASRPYDGISANSWTRVGKAEAWYASPHQLSSRMLVSLLRNTPTDLLYLNSFFNPRFSILPLAAQKLGIVDWRPTLIAPRGEFSLGALQLKHGKKASYVAAARLTALYRNAHWHATAETEHADIVRTMGVSPARITVASNIASFQGMSDSAPRTSGEPLRVCFLSRVSRKKNLDFALEVLTRTTAPVTFTVYGPIEDGAYWEDCLRLSQALPTHVAFRYEGAIPHEQVRRELAKHDLFFLPTRGENFGHALVEAWGAGLPVLVSDQTPWRNLESQGLGWDLSLLGDSAARFAEKIDEVAGFDAQALDDARSRAIFHAAALASDSNILNSYREMFKTAIHSGKRK